MRYLIPAVLLLTGCVTSQSLTDVRGDHSAVSVPHSRDAAEMAECVRGRLATLDGAHLKGVQPTPTPHDGGVSVIGRSKNGFIYAVDVADHSARVSVNTSLFMSGKTRGKLVSNVESCAN